MHSRPGTHKPSCLDRIPTAIDAGHNLTVFRCLGLLAIVLSCAAGSASARSATSKWWLSRDVQRQLHLTPEQVNRIDEIFQSNLVERRALRRQLDDLERQLSALLDSATADDAAAGAFIQRAEEARARRNVARMIMLYRIRQVLTPQQRLLLPRELVRP